MDSFISTVVFTLPGLLCYYWLQWFGFSPSQKHNTFEMLGISALLWLPVSTMTLMYYNFISVIETIYVRIVGFEKVIPYIVNLDQLKTSLGSLWFILFFSVFSIFFSYFFARIWVEKIYTKFRDHVNVIRKEKLKISPLSKNPTVWEEIFMKDGEKVIKIVKLDKPEEFIIGSIRKASRPLEPERNIALDEVDYFTKLVEKYNPIIQHVFIDIKAGVAIYMYHPKSIVDAQHQDHASVTPIISPWASESPED